jgi:hypothetical protein
VIARGEDARETEDEEAAKSLPQKGIDEEGEKAVAVRRRSALDSEVRG